MALRAAILVWCAVKISSAPQHLVCIHLYTFIVGKPVHMVCKHMSVMFDACVYEYIYAYIYLYVYIRVYEVSIVFWIYVHIYLSICIYTYIWSIDSFMNIYIYIYTSICIYTCIWSIGGVTGTKLTIATYPTFESEKYGVSTISRILKIISLFCKRAL